MLYTAAGPVRPVKLYDVLVIEEDEDELILGEDILTDLGISIDRQLEQLARQTAAVDDDPIDFGEGFCTGVSPDSEVRQAVEGMIAKALEKGFPAEKEDRLRTILYMYDIWRLHLGPDLPAKVPPLEIRLKKGAKPFRCKPRAYPPHIRKFLREFNEELVRLGWVYENASSRWACPALPIKKPGKDEFRQKNDYRPLNSDTEPIAGVMPILQVITEHVRGMCFFGLFDFITSFWQLPLAKASQELLSYMTDAKVYTPTRVPQGCCDAALHFQVTMENCFKKLLYKHLLIWIDDLLLYAEDVDTYLEKLEELFSLMNEFGLKLSAAKSSLFQRSVKWCGKIIDGDGVRHDPARIETLRAIPLPTTAGDLQQFLCACNWMRDSLVGYASHVKPLQQRLDVTLGSGKRTKRAAGKLPVTPTVEEQAAFERVKDCLASSAMLSHPSPNGVLSVFTDASDLGWSVIVTDVHAWQEGKPIADQQHRLLQCLSGTFTGSQENWSVIEKEAFAIVAACDMLPHLLLRPAGFRLYCDHRNLIHVFAPDDTVKKHIRGKLLRWAMRLGEFRYEIYHIAVEENVRADMVSRWARFQQHRVSAESKHVLNSNRTAYFYGPSTMKDSCGPTWRLLQMHNTSLVATRIDYSVRMMVTGFTARTTNCGFRRLPQTCFAACAS
ncbi:hypothetical protein PF003_g10101 [Phytophthora fragariae]|nr:hypothetical protein PF003_g10101 [Phytophthora fragariae]